MSKNSPAAKTAAKPAARTVSAPPLDSNQVRARVIVDGRFGKVNDLVVVDRQVADDDFASGSVELDSDPSAVAYVESQLAEAEAKAREAAKT